ncbi:MAG TPA: GWxTD domain-containing protein [Bacteroidota bacterium]|nr:GWxTD domain-containing protein [Bacteroidota bacterium]
MLSRFWQSDSTSFLELAIAYYPRQVSLSRDAQGFHGNVEFRIFIHNAGNGKMIYQDRFYVPVHFEDSSAHALLNAQLSKVTYVLKSGSYSIGVYGCDSTNRARCDSNNFIITIPPKPHTVAFSDLELCSTIVESNDTNDLFYKNSYRVIPNPGLVFGSTAYPVIFNYVELYHLQQRQLYVLRTQLLEANGTVVKERTQKRQFLVSNSLEVGTLNITSLPSGKYKYQMILSDTAGNELARTERPVFLYNPLVQIASVKPSSRRIAEFAGMSSDELSEEFRTAQYIARSEDKAAFAQMHNVEEQRTFLAQFWTEVETGKRGEKNITRADYLQRIETANQRYKSFGHEGWRTDRGRVYVVYGEADEVDRHPSSSDNKPYEIWHYNQIESGVEFVFIDRSGFGEYTLVHSTKRGEIQDENWQQYLQ